MPRSRRYDAPGMTHHIMLRGVAKGLVFLDDADRARFIDLLTRLVREERVLCFAWALMPNHVHMVLRSGPAPISRMMARLGTAHAMAFNRRHNRVGHLFQDRFKSVPVDSHSHLQWLVRYVHRNPIEAGLVASVAELARFRWTGHRELVDRAAVGPMATDSVLSWFAPTPAVAVRALEAWMEDRAEIPPPAETRDDPELLRAAVVLTVEEACRNEGLEPEAVFRGARSRAASRARAAAIRRLRLEAGLRPSTIERELGLSSGAVAQALRRSETFVRK